MWKPFKLVQIYAEPLRKITLVNLRMPKLVKNTPMFICYIITEVKQNFKIERKLEKIPPTKIRLNALMARVNMFALAMF